MSCRELPAASALGPPAAQLPYAASGNSCGFECQDTTTVYNSIAEDSLRGVLVDYVEIVSGEHSFISNQQILTDQTYVRTLAGWSLVSSREVYESSCGPNGDCTTTGFSDVGAGLAWDGTTKSVVRVGPCAAGECVSAWTGATWLRVAGAGPALCCSLSLAWDAPHSRLVVANANSTMFVTGGLTGVRWWSGPAMPASFRGTLGAVAAMASTRSVVGFDGATTWRLASGGWQQLATAGSPPARRPGTYAFAYDGVTKVAVLFGGSSASGPLSDTWSFDGTAWRQVPPTPAPPAAGPMTNFTAAGGLLMLAMDSPANLVNVPDALCGSDPTGSTCSRPMPTNWMLSPA